MKHLLDVSTLIALLWPQHVHHGRARAWLAGRSVVLCPITELGFLRVSTSSAFNLDMDSARKLLADFIADEQPGLIPADTRALDGLPAPTSAMTTDWYLANLAVAHGLKWATLDDKARHPAAELVI